MRCFRWSSLQAQYSKSRKVARERADELCFMRKRFIGEALSRVFPIEVESLSQQDAGEEGWHMYTVGVSGVFISTHWCC